MCTDHDTIHACGHRGFCARVTKHCPSFQRTGQECPRYEILIITHTLPIICINRPECQYLAEQPYDDQAPHNEDYRLHEAELEGMSAFKLAERNAMTAKEKKEMDKKQTDLTKPPIWGGRGKKGGVKSVKRTRKRKITGVVVGEDGADTRRKDKVEEIEDYSDEDIEMEKTKTRTETIKEKVQPGKAQANARQEAIKRSKDSNFGCKSTNPKPLQLKKPRDANVGKSAKKPATEAKVTSKPGSKKRKATDDDKHVIEIAKESGMKKRKTCQPSMTKTTTASKPQLQENKPTAAKAPQKKQAPRKPKTTCDETDVKKDTIPTDEDKLSEGLSSPPQWFRDADGPETEAW